MSRALSEGSVAPQPATAAAEPGGAWGSQQAVAADWVPGPAWVADRNSVVLPDPSWSQAAATAAAGAPAASPAVVVGEPDDLARRVAEAAPAARAVAAGNGPRRA